MNGPQLQVMERLAAMPLLDRIELAGVSGISTRAVYTAADALDRAGLTAAVSHASPIISPTKRLMLTADGLRHLARERSVLIEELLRIRPVSGQWRRILLQRLDAAAAVYRVTASIATARGPVRQFRWFRASPLDAAIMLADGRTVGIVRQGAALGRTAFAKRLLRLGDAEPPGALLVLASDPSRLEHARRLLGRFPVPVFLAVEARAIKAGAYRPAWHAPSGARAASLQAALVQVSPEGEFHAEDPPLRATIPEDLLVSEAEGDAPDHLLPACLKETEKRALDLLAAWPWLAPAHLRALLGVRAPRLSQVMGRLRRLGLALASSTGDDRRLALTDRGLALLARRDRASVGDARRHWSVRPLDAEAPPTWRNVSGARSRQLLRNIGHTEAVHSFMAALAVQSRELGFDLVQLDPPHRSAVFFRHDGRLHSVRPDASGVLRRDGRTFPFLLEWERRAVRPATMAVRIAPYLRYFASARPGDDHAAQPIVLVVFENDLTATHFLRVARRETARSGVRVPLFVSNRELLERHGPLGPAWRIPGITEAVVAFP
ncbi:MAG: hypothetical protein OXL97_06845 [Chloroflexota bacterium]|nr:hypothetical protein [Chloroflexota bacterium]MDE2883691.1 hypothetical protein [Chloroflexota bacterium]